MGLKDFLRQQEVETAKPNTSSNTSTVIKPTSQPSYKSFDDMVKQRARSEVVIKPIQQGIAPVSQGVKGNSLREVMTGTPMPASNKPVARPSNTILPMPQGRMAADARLLNPTAQPKNTINPTELTRQPVPTNNPLSQKILSGKPLQLALCAQPMDGLLFLALSAANTFKGFHEHGWPYGTIV